MPAPFLASYLLDTENAPTARGRDRLIPVPSAAKTGVLPRRAIFKNLGDPSVIKTMSDDRRCLQRAPWPTGLSPSSLSVSLRKAFHSQVHCRLLWGLSPCAIRESMRRQTPRWRSRIRPKAEREIQGAIRFPLFVSFSRCFWSHRTQRPLQMPSIHRCGGRGRYGEIRDRAPPVVRRPGL